MPLTEVADRLNSLELKLRSINGHLAGGQNLKANIDEIKVEGRTLIERAAQMDATLAEAPTLEDLKEIEANWNSENRSLDEKRKSVTQLLKQLEDDISQLESEQKLWDNTLKEYQQTVGADLVLERIAKNLTLIRNILTAAQEHRKSGLIYQNLIAEQSLIVSELLGNIAVAEEKYSDQIWQPDRRPLWKIWAAPESNQSFRAPMRQAVSQELVHIWELIKKGSGSLLRVALIFLAVSLTIVALGRKLFRWQEGRSGHGDASMFYDHPVRASLIAATLIMYWLSFPAPAPLSKYVSSLVFCAFLLLLSPLFPAAFRPLLYLLTGVHALQTCWAIFASVPLLERLTSIFALAIFVAAAAWFMRPARLKKLPDTAKAPSYMITAIWVFLGLMLVALAANLLGYFALSKLLVRGLFQAAFSAIRLYVFFRIAGTALALLLHTRKAQSLASIRLRGDVFYKWASRIFACLFLILWALRTLDGFSLGETFLKGLIAVFNNAIKIGEISFTLWDITVFVIVLLAAFALTNIVQFFLQEDVLPRFSLQRGLPVAILKMVQYVLLLVGFFVAMAAAGLDLNRFTFLAGAFGVGVGFGLQNIFNNFASGLILLFERPINIDDIIEIGGVSGKVKHIGIRSCTIRTGQGAEVIIPNSNLVSSQFTNWTYSDLYRRIDLKIGVAYGTEPERVLKLLKEVALNTPRIEKEPEPAVVFRGFGDSSLNFELRCWVLSSVDVESESDLGVAAEAALRKAGIEIPFPQRDLHLRSVADDVKDKLTKEENAKHAK